MRDLIRSISILDYVSVSEDETKVRFVNSPEGFFLEDDYDPSIHAAEISHEAWVDMGEPTQVTVTVEPGDNLNDSGLVGFLRDKSPVRADE